MQKHGSNQVSRPLMIVRANLYAAHRPECGNFRLLAGSILTENLEDTYLSSHIVRRTSSLKCLDSHNSMYST